MQNPTLTLAEQLDNSFLAHALTKLIERLNEAKERKLAKDGLTNLVNTHYDDFHLTKVGNKFAYLDAGSSGCFLVERTSGELYNIKGYGKPDYNKHKKAPLGNVATVNPDWLFYKRWNYLR